MEPRDWSCGRSPRVAGTDDLNLVGRGAEIGQLGIGQLDLGGAAVLLEPVGPLVPGIGTIQGCWLRSRTSASWAGVAGMLRVKRGSLRWGSLCGGGTRREVFTGSPTLNRAGLSSWSWPTTTSCGPRSGSSWSAAVRGSHPSRLGCASSAPAAGWRGCGGRRWRPWPASARSTTPGSSAATSPVSPRACWTESPTPSSSTRPSAGPPHQPGPGRRQHPTRLRVAPRHPEGFGQRAADPRLDALDTGIRRRQPARPAGGEQARRGSLRPDLSPTRSVHRTRRGSCSSTRTRATSGATGPPTPTTRSHCSAPRRDATPTTAA